MVETTECLNMEVEEVIVVEYAKKMKMAYPKNKEELINFLNRCKFIGFEVMLCPHCSVVFDKKSSQDHEQIKPQEPRKIG